MTESKNAKKVITWGIRYSNYAVQRELFALRNNGCISIEAEAGYYESDPEIFFRRMEFNAALKQDHDYLVVRNDEDGGRLHTLLIESGYSDEADRIITASELSKHYSADIEDTQVRIIRELRDASDEEVQDREWMRSRLNAYGFFPFFKLAKDPTPGITWTTRGILQVPDEFLDFCLYISDTKWHGRIHSAAEIGVARGSSSYIIAALLERNNPDLNYSMVDIVDDLVRFDDVSQILPCIRKRIPCTSDDLKTDHLDFCFIDADHSYKGMMNDYANLGSITTRMLVFHDIYGHEYDHLDGGTVRGWQEIKAASGGKQILEFSKYPDKWMGIGVILG